MAKNIITMMMLKTSKPLSAIKTYVIIFSNCNLSTESPYLQDRDRGYRARVEDDFKDGPTRQKFEDT